MLDTAIIIVVFVSLVLALSLFILAYRINCRNNDLVSKNRNLNEKGQFAIDVLTATNPATVTIISSALGCGNQERYLSIKIGDFKASFTAKPQDGKYTFVIPAAFAKFPYEIHA